jgi:hypothetical protein
MEESMKAFLKVLLVLAMVAPAFANSNLTGYWDFSTGTTSDLSGYGTAADGTLLGGAALVSDPLGQKGTVLNVPLGGKMTTPAAADDKFNQAQYSAIGMWVYAPNATGWWTETVGKGGSGSPRMFCDSNPNGYTYFFDYADIYNQGTFVSNLSLGDWSSMSTTGWHFVGSEIYPYVDQYGTPGFMHVIFQDGVAYASETTQQYLESADSMGLNSLLFEIAPNADWRGYIGSVATWKGYADFDTWAGMYNGSISIQNANFIPEPCTMVLLGLGALALRRRK